MEFVNLFRLKLLKNTISAFSEETKIIYNDIDSVLFSFLNEEKSEIVHKPLAIFFKKKEIVIELQISYELRPHLFSIYCWGLRVGYGEFIRICEIYKENICSICLEEKEGKKFDMETKCGHYFHQNCLNSWTDKKNTCPNCRECLGKEKEIESLLRIMMEERLNRNIYEDTDISPVTLLEIERFHRAFNESQESNPIDSTTAERIVRNSFETSEIERAENLHMLTRHHVPDPPIARSRGNIRIDRHEPPSRRGRSEESEEDFKK